MHNESAAIGGGEADVTGEADRLLEGRVRATVELVLTGNARRRLGRVGGERDGSDGPRVIMVEELGEEGPEAQLTARARVVGDEYPEAWIRATAIRAGKGEAGSAFSNSPMSASALERFAIETPGPGVV